MALREVFARFTSRFNGTAIQRGNAQVQGMVGSLRAASAGVLAFGGVVAALAIVAIIRTWVVAVNDFVQSMAAVGDTLDKTSRALGVNTTALQEWQHAANLSGVDASAFNGALRRLAANMGVAVITPTAAAAIEFRRMGVEIVGADGQLRDVTDVMMDMADPLRDMTSNTQRVATATALMGRSGARLNPLFLQGREGIAAMRAELEELGGGATPEMIQASADLVDAQARLDLSILSIKTRIATQLLPIFQGMVDATREVTAWFARNEKALALVKIGLIAVGVVVGLLALAFAAVLGPVLLLLLLIMSPLILAVTGLILVIEDLYVWFNGGESVIGTFVESLLSLAGVNFNAVRLAFRAFIDEVREGYNSVAEVLGLPTISGGTVVRDTRNLGAKEETTPSEAREQQEAPEAPGFLRRLRGFTTARQAELGGTSGVRGFIPRSGGGRGGDRTVTQTTSFEIRGNDPQAIAESVRQIMDSQNRSAAEALGQ